MGIWAELIGLSARIVRSGHRLCCVIRLDTIKLAPVVLAARCCEDMDALLCNMGQHKEMSPQILELFGHEPATVACPKSLQLMAIANQLLVIGSPDKSSVFLPNKLVGNLGTGVPILGILQVLPPV